MKDSEAENFIYLFQKDYEAEIFIHNFQKDCEAEIFPDAAFTDHEHLLFYQAKLSYGVEATYDIDDYSTFYVAKKKNRRSLSTMQRA